MRHRGFFLHSETTGETESVEQENPEGFVIRVRIRRRAASRHFASRAHRPRTERSADGRSRIESEVDEAGPAIRSGSVTGSRQRAHMPR